MSKTDLQSTTHGGGRVLSVILAGTLAMGMTPAVALTTQTLQPMQAFAADASATITIPNGSPDATDSTITNVAYTGSAIVPTVSNFNAGDSSTTENQYQILVDGAADKEIIGAGSYTVTFALKEAPNTVIATQKVQVTKVEPTIDFDESKLVSSTPLDAAAATTLLNTEGVATVTGLTVGTTPEDVEGEFTVDAQGVAQEVTGADGTKTQAITYTFTPANTSPSSNYSVVTKTTNVSITSQDTPAAPTYDITIGGVGYNVEVVPTGAVNELVPGTEGVAVDKLTYSYDAIPQAPTVTVQYTDDKGVVHTPAKGSYQVVYSLPNASGSTQVPTNPGVYSITVEELNVATPNTFPAGEFEITTANINDPKQVLITWNGEQVNGGGNTNVTMNNVAQWKAALKIIYPATGAAVDEAQYSVTQPTGTQKLIIAPAASTPSFSSYLTDVVTTEAGSVSTPVEIDYTLANYAIAGVAVNAEWVKANAAALTYKGSQITIPEAQLDAALNVTANGRALPQYTVIDNNTGKEVSISGYQVITASASHDGDVYTVTTGTDAVPAGAYTVTKNWNVSYGANINAGTGTVTVTGTGNYAGEQTAQFTIAPYDISKAAAGVFTVVEDASNPITFNNQEQTPNVKVTNAVPGVATAGDIVSYENNKSKKFTVAYDNNVNATTDTSVASVTVTPTDPNYTGTKVLTFQIAQYDLSKPANKAVTTNPNIAFVPTGADYEAKNPTVVSGLVNKDKSPVAMTLGKDYKIIQNTAGTTGQAPVTQGAITITQGDLEDGQAPVNYAIQGQGNYKGTIYGTYYVTQNSISQYIESASAPVDVQYDGTAQTPEFAIKLKGQDPVLIDDTNAGDYGLSVTYGNNKNASTSATISIAAAGEADNGMAYYGTYRTYTWTIEAADLTNATFGIILPEKAPAFQYTGSQIKPAVAVANPDKNVNPGYTDPDLYNEDAKAGYIVTAKGTEILLDNIKDEYAISYGENTNVTNAAKTNAGTVTITAASSNLKGAATEKFNILPADIDPVQASPTGPIKAQADGARYAEPTVTVTSGKKTLVRGVDYTLTVSPQQTAGTPAKWTVKGMGNYTGEYSGNFIPVDDIAEATIVMPDETYTYDGTEKKPVPVITIKSGNETTTLKSGANYTVSYKNNINAGTATVIITGVYTAADPTNDVAASYWGGTVEKTFTIAQAQGTLAIDAVDNATYTGAAITPEPNFTFTVGSTVYNKADLTAGTDYKYVYTNNTDSEAVSGKKATVGVQMIGNYGAANNGAVSFSIAQANVASADVVVGDVNVGKTPKVAVSLGGRALVQGKDFTFAADTKTPGTKTATITGIGNYTGTQAVTFVVLKDNQVPADDANLEGGTWKKTNGVWQYTTKDGKLVSSGWAKINGQYYYFDSKGNAKTGWLDDNGTWYYLNKAGEGTECAMVSNAWKKINGNWYHFAKSGAMQTGWQKINGAWYYLNKKGEGTEGAMRTGWQKINGAWYYLNKAGQGTEGAMKTGWFNDNGTWYYLLTAAEGTEGKMVSNQWKQINGSWFYFYAGGAMAANTWVGNYYVDANGYWVR